MLRLTHDNQEFPVQVGQFLTRVEEVKQLVVGLHNGTPVYLEDIATVSFGVNTATQNVWTGDRDGIHPAVTIAVAKKGGENAVDVAKAVEARLVSLENQLIPQGIDVDITRDYGQTAADKSNTLMGKLAFATTAVVILVLLTMGWRESIVVGMGEPVSPDMTYRYREQKGFIASVRRDNLTFLGNELIAISERRFTSKEQLQAAKRFTRLALKPYLGGKPLKSRELFRQTTLPRARSTEE